jgi:ABC-type transporter Mla subunit MlaD
MSMLGAQLEDLVGLSQQLNTTTAEVGTVQANSLSTTSQVVSSVTSSAQDGLRMITQHMEALRSTVEAARGRLASTMWTGQNQVVFEGAYGEFTTAMTAAETSMNDVYASFQTQITNMTSELNDFVTRFSNSMTQAQASTQSMSTAVAAQRDNLDQVMNTGMSVG